MAVTTGERMLITFEAQGVRHALELWPAPPDPAAFGDPVPTTTAWRWTLVCAGRGELYRETVYNERRIGDAALRALRRALDIAGVPVRRGRP